MTLAERSAIGFNTFRCNVHMAAIYNCCCRWSRFVVKTVFGLSAHVRCVTGTTEIHAMAPHTDTTVHIREDAMAREGHPDCTERLKEISAEPMIERERRTHSCITSNGNRWPD